jgi:NAD(P)-dependent dehydrogenase (short-subunit alcohol dehydrogenase family)
MHIDGNCFIVTGAASGLGAATAAMLVSQGGKVILADLAAEGAEAARALGEASARFVRADVSSESAGLEVVAAASSLGPLRGLVNCAGVAPAYRTLGRDGPHGLHNFERVLRVNLLGTFNMIRLAAQAMAALQPLDSGERGVIVNTASIAAFDGQIGQAAYAASKAGVAGMTLPVARDLARHAIRVVSIAPGIFGTPMVKAMPPAVQESLGRLAPFPQRLGRPEEFAQLVRHVFENEMLNGETIRLDAAVRMGAQ